ncbi:MAG: hypothetical protein AAB403_12580 [Planctomycetota bacterium]
MKASEFFVRTIEPAKNTCFVLMPFEEGMTAVYEHGIKPLVESLGIQCRRADEIYSAQNILGDIWASIQSAEIIVADLTGKNPNVMYELGLCHALWKRVILLSQNKDDVPFDLRAWRVIWYDFTFAGATRLKDELQRAIQALRAGEAVESELRPLTPRAHRRGAAPREPKPGQPEWLHGTIESWKAEQHFGFIRAGDEDFYFNQGYLFADHMEPAQGRRVVFVPLDPLEEGKSRRASRIFVHGVRLEGRVSHIRLDKGFAFADVQGQRGEHHSLFVLILKDMPIGPGALIECVVGDNESGPIGTDVVLKESAR